MSIGGFLSWGKVNIIPATTIFDVLILLSVLLTKPVIKNRTIGIILYLLICYLILSIFYSVIYQNDHILDLLLSYKAFFYLTLLCFFFGKSIGTAQNYNFLFKTLLAFFLIKYIISVAFGISGRPILFRENNFELMFLALLFYLQYLVNGKVKGWEWVVTTIIFLISGSKSAIPIFIVVACSILFKKISIKKLMLAIPILMLMLGIFFVLIMNKYGETGLDGVDRIAFLRVFLLEMQQTPFINIFIGHERMTPLMPSSCQSLWFYEGLFSFKQDGSCYSPILHSYLLRVIFDHGLLGMLAVFWITHILLIKSGYSGRDSLVLNTVMFLNGMSVSAYNSGFFALSLIAFLGFSRAINKDSTQNTSFKGVKIHKIKVFNKNEL
jgi:hypothetical protein